MPPKGQWLLYIFNIYLLVNCNTKKFSGTGYRYIYVHVQCTNVHIKTYCIKET